MKLSVIFLLLKPVNKQKSMLDTKFKTLVLNSDGTTNYDNIKWCRKCLLFSYDNRIIPLRLYKNYYKGKLFVEILMNESFEYYKSQRPIEYLYEKIK